MVVEANKIDLDKLNSYKPEELLTWAYENYGERAGIVTSFQTTGCVMIEMSRKVAPEMRVITIDSLRLHDETYQLIDEIERHYGLTVERFKPDPKAIEEMVERFGEFLFFDDKAKQEYCCKVRKVEPNLAALDTLEVWFTGLRRDQSDFRKESPKSTLINHNGRKIIKISALVDWSECDLDTIVRNQNIPRNALYDQNYTSIGCKICTTPTRSGEDKRAGRWRWFNQFEEPQRKECGIHVAGSGI